jgi:hypothetical protein
MSMDFEKEVAGIVALVPQGIKLAPETALIAAGALEEVDRDYGPESDNPHDFHDAPHSVGAIRRGVRLANMLYPYIRPIHRRRFHDLVIVGESVHDRYRDRAPNNEAESAEFGVKKVEEADGPLNTKSFKRRLPYGVMATAVTIESDGRVVQHNMLRGSRDPIKFVMGFGDKNGIAMEGEKRMWSDAADLYYEVTPSSEQTVEGLVAFIGKGQKQFLRQGLNDPLIKAYIARYFPDDKKAVYDDMHEAFHDNIASAHDLACKVSERPELQEAIGHIARRVDRSRVGPLIGKMIRRKVAHSQ